VSAADAGRRSFAADEALLTDVLREVITIGEGPDAGPPAR